MVIRLLVLVLGVSISGFLEAQIFSGVVRNESGAPLKGVEVLVVEDSISTITSKDGSWSIKGKKTTSQTLVFYKEGYAYEQIVKQEPSNSLSITLRTSVKSLASIREEGYIKNGCETVQIPDDASWNVNFEITELKGDLAPDSNYTRRDPSAVIKVDDQYYIWYSYSLTFDTAKIAPWDLNDLYYATSKDGVYWEEQGIAVGRGTAGSFDHRSVFTTEIMAHEGIYYLVYQAASGKDGIYNRNTVGMATSTSPDGPWTKVDEPILHPTYTNNLFFDNNAVHDPCIVAYNDKFYLYYKGECQCRDNDSCVYWCNPICGTFYDFREGFYKQVKWGVAIAENPTGPYIKSASNPITNTGHEVMVWPYKKGTVILQHQDGPEGNTIQYSKNGLDFNIMGSVLNIPEAAGLFRNEKSDNDPHAGISWGVGHKLNWDAGINRNGWMYIYRFDSIKPSHSSK